jgi:hypothetical protein
MKSSASVEISIWQENSLTMQRDGRSIRAGARDRWCTMRDEFASKGFLVVERFCAFAGVAMLCSGLLAFAFV